MLSNEKIEYLKGHFYGWEYSVQNNLPVKMTNEHIELLLNVFIDLEDLKEINGRLIHLSEKAISTMKETSNDTDKFLKKIDACIK